MNHNSTRKRKSRLKVALLISNPRLLAAVQRGFKTNPDVEIVAQGNDPVELALSYSRHPDVLLRDIVAERRPRQ